MINRKRILIITNNRVFNCNNSIYINTDEPILEDQRRIITSKIEGIQIDYYSKSGIHKFISRNFNAVQLMASVVSIVVLIVTFIWTGVLPYNQRLREEDNRLNPKFTYSVEQDEAFIYHRIYFREDISNISCIFDLFVRVTPVSNLPYITRDYHLFELSPKIDYQNKVITFIECKPLREELYVELLVYNDLEKEKIQEDRPEAFLFPALIFMIGTVEISYINIDQNEKTDYFRVSQFELSSIDIDEYTELGDTKNRTRFINKSAYSIYVDTRNKVIAKWEPFPKILWKNSTWETIPTLEEYIKNPKPAKVAQSMINVFLDAEDHPEYVGVLPPINDEGVIDSDDMAVLQEDLYRIYCELMGLR
ncbi:MAG: hypothetical protein VB087_06835 [Candidatus Limiplasma sp.]|nr:hypothetical protein [Candidatus Limiplasma sp.]